ncbi:MAG: tetratricopeptide repeat protein [Calditrichaeota bacterium]|nr:MAG: tetratricopeptide repeat protein [Calditrichota bacterium]MBL1205524.1 tetratricopeptide repeat protein [Calditrichota bacterium]NOG45353.1 tetratricopeptide repeat protein [Calditrichota bacterium]
MKAITFLLITLAVSPIWANNIQQGKDHYAAGEFDKAKEIFETILDENDENAEVHHWLGRTFFRLGDIDEAVDHCEESVELDDKNAEYHFWYGQVLGREVQEASVFRQPFLAPKVLEEFERTIELDPKHVGGRVGAAQYYLMAPGIMGGDNEKAEEYAKVLIDMEVSRGYLLLAQVYEAEDKIDKAEEVFAQYDAAFNDSTDNPNFYNSYGYFLINQKKYDLAIEKFNRQVELNPKSANSYDSLGDGYRAAGRLEEALASYKKAVKINPNFEASKNNIEELEKELKK